MNLYKFMGKGIGTHSFDWFTFILFRRSKDVKIKKYPFHVGISTQILMDLKNHGTRVIIIKIDGRAVLRTDPDTWLKSAKIDKLTDDQDPHAFLPLTFFDKIIDPTPYFTQPKRPVNHDQETTLKVFF